jgi:hypothetical protein
MPDDPRDYPPPTNFVDRINEFARDLAYGVNVGEWTPEIWVDDSDPRMEYWSSGGSPIYTANLTTYLDRKWPYDEARERNGHPSFSFLEAWGYLTFKHQINNAKAHLLAPKAFTLLQKPTAPPSVFISYSRKHSSPFALLVEARLRLVGVPNPFVDKNLVPGEAWLVTLEERVRQARYFVCLVGPDTLESPWVQKEIEWALEAKSVIITIWHGLKISDVDAAIKALPFFAELGRRQIIEVKGVSADDYETAVNRLLNALGYQTY